MNNLRPENFIEAAIKEAWDYALTCGMCSIDDNFWLDACLTGYSDGEYAEKARVARALHSFTEDPKEIPPDASKAWETACKEGIDPSHEAVWKNAYLMGFPAGASHTRLWCLQSMMEKWHCTPYEAIVSLRIPEDEWRKYASLLRDSTCKNGRESHSILEEFHVSLGEKRYFSRPPKERLLFDIFFNVCQRLDVHWDTASDSEKSMCSAMTQLVYKLWEGERGSP